jgi:hypothetical protein
LLKSPGLAEEGVEVDELEEDVLEEDAEEPDPVDFLARNSLNFSNLPLNDVSVDVEVEADDVPPSSSSSSNINSLYFLIM